MVPHGPINDEKWSRTHIYKKVIVPWVVRNGPNSYLNVDTCDLSTRSIDHGRYRRSMRIYLLQNTVHIDRRCRFTYGELRSIVDGRLKIEIILWSISSAQEWTNRNLAVHELTSVHFLFFEEYLYSITEITEY